MEQPAPNLRVLRRLGLAVALCVLAGCGSGPAGTTRGPFAPGVDPRAGAPDSVAVGHRLVNAGEYELAIRAFNRAALARGALDAEVLTGLGTANLGLGRLGQAETLLRRAAQEDPSLPEVWNNLGVVLMERGKAQDAAQAFRRAFALDDGESTLIRDNLRLALATLENSATLPEEQNYTLERRGSGAYVLRPSQSG